KQVSEDKEEVGGSLGQTAHEVRVPLGPERNVNAHLPALSHQALLQITPDAVQHLELECVPRNVLANGERFCLIDNALVMRGQPMIDPALYERLCTTGCEYLRRAGPAHPSHYGTSKTG